MYAPLWADLSWDMLLLAVAVWLFLQGLYNISKRKVSPFGIDAIAFGFDRLIKSKNSHWDDPKRLLITGIMVIILSVEGLFAAVIWFFQYVLRHFR
jgi:hypothetical protein